MAAWRVRFRFGRGEAVKSSLIFREPVSGNGVKVHLFLGMLLGVNAADRITLSHHPPATHTHTHTCALLSTIPLQLMSPACYRRIIDLSFVSLHSMIVEPPHPPPPPPPCPPSPPLLQRAFSASNPQKEALCPARVSDVRPTPARAQDGLQNRQGL